MQTMMQRPAPGATKPATTAQAARPGGKTFTRSRGITRAAWKAVFYGTGGIGKSELASKCPGVLMADLEGGTKDLEVDRVEGIENWADLRSWLIGGDFEGVKTIAIDSITKAEEWCQNHIIGTVRHDKGQPVTRIEDYGFGKGYVHVFEEWRRFLCDLEQHYRQGRNVILIAHEQISVVPNPTGEDFKRYQPRLQSSEKANSLAATKEWADHVFFISYDSSVKDGKAKGDGTRTIFCTETPSRMAKVRGIAGDPIPFQRGDTRLWDMLNHKPADDVPPAD